MKRELKEKIYEILGKELGLHIVLIFFDKVRGKKIYCLKVVTTKGSQYWVYDYSKTPDNLFPVKYVNYGFIAGGMEFKAEPYLHVIL